MMSQSGRRRGVVFGLFVVLVVVLVAWILFRKSMAGKEVIAAGNVPALTLTSVDFNDGGLIPARYTCDGEDISPQLTISTPPTATKSLLLIVDDPDAPLRSFVHWVIFNLPISMTELPEGVSTQPEKLQRAIHGANDFDKNAYGGPCPPQGKPHHYYFRVYALDTTLPLPEGATRSQVAQAAKGHILAAGKLVGLYGR
jgi:Raf kinase inhibitor-like YbhB/YbcL family protein